MNGILYEMKKVFFEVFIDFVILESHKTKITVVETVTFSIIMPVYNQAEYVARAINSLVLQSFAAWELIIVNDGSTDSTKEVLTEYYSNDRIRYIENQKNLGLGKCLNIGIGQAKYDYIAYLPSDDVWHANHMQSLYNALISDADAVLAYSGCNADYGENKFSSGWQSVAGQSSLSSLQLVQVAHKKINEKWTERDEWVTDDLNEMFWNKLLAKGKAVYTGEITCEWVDHPQQRHKIINESYGGGIYLYKQHYNVEQPIVYKTLDGTYIDERKQYKDYRTEAVFDERKGLKILLVGELAFNAERICALEERGHKLYGLWIKDPQCWNASGPLPFGNIETVSYDNMEENIRAIAPDVIYALLNYHAVPLAHYVMSLSLDIPFVWHFKEGPFYCRQMGLWKEMSELYGKADGVIYINETLKQWYSQCLHTNDSLSFILDGDLPKENYFTSDITPLLSGRDGEVHTVVSGRPIGLHPHYITEFTAQKIHLHFYGNAQQIIGQWKGAGTPEEQNYIHIHSPCEAKNWVKEFSQYDAGWLHYFRSNNNGELMRASWHDLNYPARMSTLACAGLPMILFDNTEHIVASQLLLTKMNAGIFFKSIEDLGNQLRNKQRMKELRGNVCKNRMQFSFDYHADDLIVFFKEVIGAKCSKKAEQKEPFLV